MDSNKHGLVLIEDYLSSKYLITIFYLCATMQILTTFPEGEKKKLFSLACPTGHTVTVFSSVHMYVCLCVLEAYV